VPAHLQDADRAKLVEFMRVLQVDPEAALELFDKQAALFQANPESYAQMLAEAKGVAVAPRSTEPAGIP
jgi:predicted house-cleaning NTP pyrophosphatase (Maf/HAM1 superfamily)